MADDKQPKRNYNCYLIDGDLYIGITSILKMEGMGDFLVPWALKTFGKEPNPIQAHKDYMEYVSGLGSKLHKYIELDMAGETFPERELTADMLPAIESWIEWKSQHKVEMIASEKVVNSKLWRCAGTLDGVLRIDGKLYVIDFKTGKFKSSYFTQLASYWAMLCQEPKNVRIPGIEDAELAVIEITRDGAPVKFITLEGYYKAAVSKQDELGNFHCLRYLWYSRNLKSRTYEPIIKNMDVLLNPLDKNFRKQFKL